MIIRSFDVFDTCITRMHAHPRDLFYDLGLRLAPTGLSKEATHTFAKRFQRMRIRAEKLANYRARPKQEHADIYAIYTEFRSLFGTQFELNHLVMAELALEEESIYPIGEMVAKINLLRIEGYTIWFVSDMYIPSGLLAPILIRKGVMQAEDKLYVSCDYGLTKHSGNLFRKVLSLENAHAAKLVHTGDNIHADIKMAKQHGIQTEHFPHAILVKHELKLAGNKLPRSVAATTLAAISRRFRLASRERQGNEHPLDGLIHNVVVPFILAYVVWVLDQARELGLQRLYFVARDGEIFLKAARNLGFANAPELRYLYGSRRAWVTPSITQDSDVWKKMLVYSNQSNSPNTRYDVLARAGLSESENCAIREHWGCSAEEWKSALSQEAAYAFLDQITSEKNIFYSCSSLKEGLALSYLGQEGLLDKISWALVDTGWALNSQAALGRILHLSNKLSGFYVALSHKRLSTSVAGTAHRFITRENSIFARRRVVVEHCFTPATHTTTQGYQREENTIIPVFGQELRGHYELDYAQRLHAAVEVAAITVANDTSVLAAIRQYTPQIIANAEQFLRHPDSQDAQLLASFGTIVDPRHEMHLVQLLCKPLSLTDVRVTLQSTVFNRINSKLSLPIWPEGSTAISPWYTRWPMQMLLKAVELRDRLREKRETTL